MKRNFMFIKSLMVICGCILLLGCEEKSVEIEYYPISKVSKYGRDTNMTNISYGSDNRISGYNIYVKDSYAYSASVRYGSGSIYYTANNLVYNIQLSNTRGGIRAESIRVATLEGAALYLIEYEYDDEGRMWRVRLNGIGPEPIYNHYKYEGNTIIIDDAGTEYRLQLSSEDNTGFVCNVLDFAGAPYTSQYVINPDLYFLNIYGAPIKYLPAGTDVKRYSNSNLSHVGEKYYYEY